MRESVFEKATKILSDLVFDGRGNWFEFWRYNYLNKHKVPDYIHMKIQTDSNGTLMSCTCKNCSIHNNKYMCKFKIALILRKCMKK